MTRYKIDSGIIASCPWRQTGRRKIAVEQLEKERDSFSQTSIQTMTRPAVPRIILPFLLFFCLHFLRVLYCILYDQIGECYARVTTTAQNKGHQNGSMVLQTSIGNDPSELREASRSAATPTLTLVLFALSVPSCCFGWSLCSVGSRRLGCLGRSCRTGCLRTRISASFVMNGPSRISRRIQIAPSRQHKDRRIFVQRWWKNVDQALWMEKKRKKEKEELHSV